MKKRDSAMLIASVAFVALLFVSQINLSTITRFDSTEGHSINIRELRGLELKKKIGAKKEIKTENLVELHPSTTSFHSPPPPEAEITCDRSHVNYDICSSNGPIVLDPNSSTFFLMGQTNSVHQIEKIRPYPRKWETQIMSRIKELTITSGPSGPLCQIQHCVPALVFSAGGYTGNFFHEFSDGFIPLFITVNNFFSDQEFILVVSKSRDWWVSKYSELLHSFSKHPIVDIDNDSSTHCFPAAKLGLVSHGFMTIDPESTPNSISLVHFRAFLNKVYGPPSVRQTARPKLVLIIRSGEVGRVILNQNEVKQMAEEIGFDVIVFDPSPNIPIRKAYELLDSSDVMVGVHGAAMTHLLFLRRGAVVVQVVPIGTDWAAEVCYGRPAREMGLGYLEYKIGVEESSLMEKYGKDHVLVKDPGGILKEGWSNEFIEIYLKNQSVKIDLIRFKEYLEKAYTKANKF